MLRTTKKFLVVNVDVHDWVSNACTTGSGITGAKGVSDMREVTLLLDQYRECARHLYNTHFKSQVADGEAVDWDLKDLYNDIASQLFGAIVLYPLGVEAKLTPHHLVPKIPLPIYIKLSEFAAATVMINREVNSGYWDVRATEQELNDVVFSMLSFFDFDSYGFMEMRYYLVLIESAPSKPEIERRQALIPVEYGKAYVAN